MLYINMDWWFPDKLLLFGVKKRKERLLNYSYTSFKYSEKLETISIDVISNDTKLKKIYKNYLWDYLYYSCQTKV